MDAREVRTAATAGDAPRPDLGPARRAAVVLGIVGMLGVVAGGLSVLLL